MSRLLSHSQNGYVIALTNQKGGVGYEKRQIMKSNYLQFLKILKFSVE